MQEAARRKHIKALNLEENARQRYESKECDAGDEERLEFRQQLAVANRAIVFERLIGKSDLLRINYLERGLRAAKAVGHIDVRNGNDTPVADGTGFLISPRLLMTNAHVLLDEDEGNHSLVEFDYEDDVNSIPKRKRIFALQANEFFYRNEDLDFAIVAVSGTDVRGEANLDDYGFIRMRAVSGKAIPSENVTIVQHPEGRSKEIACRSNEVIRRQGIYIHYSADTHPGSSGAPVFSDEWELVALHHAGVHATNNDGQILNKDGDLWDADQGEDAIEWEANEGIRISAILEKLQSEFDAISSPLLSDALFQADIAAGPYVDMRRGVSLERRNAAWYEAANGYDPDFLGPEARVELPEHNSHPDASDALHYRNFSVVIHRSRRQALFTACNIDGALRVASSKSAKWIKDRRLEAHFQLGDEFYKDQAGRKNKLDRGHLVKRTDPSWGDFGAEAIVDTFHFSNSALQHRSFNNGIWGRLEDALEGRFVNRTIMSVFTGPIFSPSDPEVIVNFEGVEDRERIPLEFWKVIAFADEDGFFATAGFRQSQAALIRAMDSDFTDEAGVEDLITHQVPIQQISDITGLGFHDLADFEATESQLEARGDRWRRTIRRADDFVLAANSNTRRPTRLAKKSRRKVPKKSPKGKGTYKQKR